MIFAHPRTLSQLITSFVASQSQGIPCVPLVTYLLIIILYQFNYYFNQFQYVKERYLKIRLVEDNGFEPLTPCVQGRCSSQLS
jgi:hypothetical protein